MFDRQKESRHGKPCDLEQPVEKVEQGYSVLSKEARMTVGSQQAGLGQIHECYPILAETRHHNPKRK